MKIVYKNLLFFLGYAIIFDHCCNFLNIKVQHSSFGPYILSLNQPIKSVLSDNIKLSCFYNIIIFLHYLQLYF